MIADQDWQADLQRYPHPRPFLKEQSLWAVWVYRFGRRLDNRPDGLLKRVLTPVYWLLFRVMETLLGISLPKSAVIGPGLRIWHFGGVFIHPDVRIGENCTLRQGVTIGNRIDGGPVPLVGDNVEFGAYAQVLGGIRIGNDCKIGAMSVVLDDVPDGATAVGVPARIIPPEPDNVVPILLKGRSQ
jgi:serine O-acetyltransferase